MGGFSFYLVHRACFSGGHPLVKACARLLCSDIFCFPFAVARCSFCFQSPDRSLSRGASATLK
jgi:hypothetical protein